MNFAIALVGWWAVTGAVASNAKPVKAESVLLTLVDQAEVAAQEAGVLAELAVREGQWFARAICWPRWTMVRP